MKTEKQTTNLEYFWTVFRFLRLFRKISLNEEFKTIPRKDPINKRIVCPEHGQRFSFAPSEIGRQGGWKPTRAEQKIRVTIFCYRDFYANEEICAKEDGNVISLQRKVLFPDTCFPPASIFPYPLFSFREKNSLSSLRARH